MDKTETAIRQKAYEHAARQFLPRRTYTLIRLDGKGFHRYTKQMRKPFDTRLSTCMTETTEYLLEQVKSAVIGYTQSDEITLLLTDFTGPKTQPWLGGNVQKITSITAAMATAKFNQVADSIDWEGELPDEFAFFDSRAFTVPTREAAIENFYWRQADCRRNSISMLAQSVYKHSELQGVNSADVLAKLASDGFNWENYPQGFRYGFLAYRDERTKDVQYVDSRGVPGIALGVKRRHRIVVPAPIFRRSEILQTLIPEKEEHPVGAS